MLTPKDTLPTSHGPGHNTWHADGRRFTFVVNDLTPVPATTIIESLDALA